MKKEREGSVLLDVKNRQLIKKQEMFKVQYKFISCWNSVPHYCQIDLRFRKVVPLLKRNKDHLGR